jgi:hypothetical protein
MDTPVPELATDTRSLLLFLFVTVGLGGGAAAIAGRAIAATWRPWWDVVKYMFLLAAPGLSGRRRCLPDCRIVELPPQARAADGHILRLDQPARRPAPLARPALTTPRHRIRMTFAAFTA